MARSAYHIRVFYGGNEWNWHKTKPGRKLGMYAESIDEVEERLAELWPLDIEEIRYGKSTLYVWCPDPEWGSE